MTVHEYYQEYLKTRPVDVLSESVFYTKIRNGMSFEEVCNYKRDGFEGKKLWEEYEKSTPKSNRVHEKIFRLKHREGMCYDELMALRPVRKKYRKKEEVIVETVYDRINRKRRMQGMEFKNGKWEYIKK